VPCVAPARGKNDVKLPFKPGTQHDPCAAKIVTSVGGTNVSAQNLCLWHLTMKLGQAAMLAPVVQAP
jgi:hypothetical protein